MWIELLRAENAVAGIAPSVFRLPGVREAEFVAVKPLLSAFTLAAHSRQDALSSMSRGAS